MTEPIVCWSCYRTSPPQSIECAACFAGLDAQARGLSSDAAAAEQLRLQARSHGPASLNPAEIRPQKLGFAFTLGLILLAVPAAFLLAMLIGGIANSQPCDVDDFCGEGYGAILLGFNTFLFAFPGFAVLFIMMARQSRRKQASAGAASRPVRDAEPR